MKRRRILPARDNLGRFVNRDGFRIHETGHTASMISTDKNGVTLVAGTIRHEPWLMERGRTSDHADLALPPGWWLAVRNTVPSI